MRSCVKLGAGGPFCCRGCAHSASWGRSELAMVWAWWAVAVLAVAGHQVSGHPVNGSGCASTRVVHVHLIMPLSGQCGSRRSAWFLAVRTPDPASLRFLAQPPNGQPQVLIIRSSYHPSGTVVRGPAAVPCLLRWSWAIATVWACVGSVWVCEGGDPRCARASA